LIEDELPLMTSQHLIKDEVIPSLPNKPEVVWDTGASFVEGCGTITDKKEIPCCNTDGKRIPSEIGPMTYDG
jgi:hypothetical protein